jgi:hypothetical protein
MAYEDEFIIGERGKSPKFSILDERTVKHPFYDAPLDSLRSWANRPNAHENIDTLINQDDNKDYFELMNVVENFVGPTGAIKLLQLFNQPAKTEQAFQKGLIETILGEPDPVGPQGLPFSKFLQQKKAVNSQVKSILENHVNDLTK